MTMIDALEPCPDCGSHHHKSCRTINARQKAEHKLNLELQKLLLRKKAMPPMNKPNAPGEGSELPAMGLLEAAQALVEVMETCHVCKGLIILQEYAIHCEDCSYYCENHDGPECVPIYELHRRLKAALSSPQQESEIVQFVRLVEHKLDQRLQGQYTEKQILGMLLKLSREILLKYKIEPLVAPPVTAEGKDRG